MTSTEIQLALSEARADAWREYADAEDAYVAFNAIDRVAAHVAATLEALNG